MRCITQAIWGFPGRTQMDAAQATGPESWKVSSHERSADRFPEMEEVVQANLGIVSKGQDPEEHHVGLHKQEQGDSYSGTVSQ